jgi:hypothetical protein
MTTIRNLKPGALNVMTEEELANLQHTMVQEDSTAPAAVEPNAIELARKRTNELVENIAGEARLSCRRSRDELDNLMAQIDTSQKKLSHYIGEFARFSAEAITTAHEISKAVRRAAEPFGATEPRTTITEETNQ